MRKAKLLLKIVLAVGVLISLIVYRAGFISAKRLSDGKVITIPQMVSELDGTRLVFAGENHDSIKVHQAQLEIIKGLHKKEAPLAIGLEMFTTETQAELDRWVAGILDLASFKELYQKEWNMPWHLYRDILMYAREQRIPLVALNIPRDISRKVGKTGFDSLTPEERKKLPEGLTCSVDPAYRAFISRAFSLHPGSGRSFDYFCEAQMLWNKGMGWNLKQFLNSNPGYTVVVLAGSGHAIKQGIPAEISNYGFTFKVILPDFPNPEREKATSLEADYLLLFGLKGLVQ